MAAHPQARIMLVRIASPITGKLDLMQAMLPTSVEAHAMPAEQLIETFRANTEQGLDTQEVSRRRTQYGLNQLQEEPGESWLVKLLRQFKSVLIVILLIAALLAGFMQQWTEAWAILSIVFLNGIIGFLQESRAEKAIARLQELGAPQARVMRGGQKLVIAAAEVVPGDLIEMEAGDFVPADARLVEAYDCRCQEAALTGESLPVSKQSEEALDVKTSLAERTNMIFLGTTLLAGRAKAIITATGMQTELGHIAGILQRQPHELTPLQVRLAELGRVLIVLCLAMIALIFILYGARGTPLNEVFLFAISLAVAVIPEGLPAFVTIALALGLTRMAQRNALIRRLPSVETLGSVTVICTDKTGTLTRNEMTVRELQVGPHLYQINGTGYKPEGEFLKAGEDPFDPQSDADVKLALTIGARCNHASLLPDDPDENSWKILGDPTEAALLVVARKGGVILPDDHMLQSRPFDDRKLMSVVVQLAEANPRMLCKGAPEAVLNRCDQELWNGTIRALDAQRRQQLLESGQTMAGKALRVLGLAFREFKQSQTLYKEEKLVFVGLVGMMDPPREEVKAAIQSCRAAGIKPVMITGDHPATARAIALELGLMEASAAACTGQTLDTWDADELSRQVTDISVYARVSPSHKLRVVEAWKKRGAIVAMTGDGVNDAPAVKAADIGIAMGITGTDVTKAASDIILMDDNFVSIVSAVEEGRGILDNIKNIMHYLLAGNASEVILVLVCVIAGWPIPLQPMQILWINLATDGFPALALATERPEPGIMQRKVRPTKEALLTWSNGRRILGHGLLLAAVMLLGFYWAYFIHSPTRGNVPLAQTVTFFICAMAQLFFALACRSERHTFIRRGVWTNPLLIGAILFSAGLQLLIISIDALHPIFLRSDPQFGWETWGPILILSLIPVCVVEFFKAIRSEPQL